MSARTTAALLSALGLIAAVVLTITNHDATAAWAFTVGAGGTTAGISIPAPAK